MNDSRDQIKALGLCSGGLDSILAALVLKKQNIHVEWITFETPFFSSQKARKASQMTKIPLTVRNITREYLKMLKNPACGYGQHMNPCMDCHALMFRLAGELMEKKGFHFLFSGEVVGQRPMSQTKPSLRYVEKHSGHDGFILRPLSAKLLPETIPEQNGDVNREELMDFSGRSRKPQIKLAGELGINDYPNPAGGCLLTDAGYTSRLKDLFEHQDDFSENELHLLRYGRHLRLNTTTKAIIGRNKKDNERILKWLDPLKDRVIKIKGFPGPICTVPADATKEMLTLAASICAGYSSAPEFKPVQAVAVNSRDKEAITVLGLPPEDVKHYLI